MTAPSNAELREAIRKTLNNMLQHHDHPADAHELDIDDILALFQAREQQLLSELLGELPEYLPECLKYPLGSGTVCNKCRACKLRHYDTNGEAGTVFDFTIELVVEILSRKIGELNG